MTIQDINLFLTSSELNDFLFPLKLIFVLLSLVMVCLTVYYLIRQSFLLGETRRKFKNLLSSQDFSVQSDLFNQWKEIKELLLKEDQINYKIIVNKSANLFFDVLEKSNMSDKSIDELDERHIPNIQSIKEIIALSFKLKKDPTIEVDIDKIKELISSFEKTLQKLHLF